MRSVLLLVVCAACGGTSKPSGTPGHEAGRAAATPCPEERVVEELAAKAWPSDEGAEDLWCVALRVHDDTQWWIAGYIRADDQTIPARALASPDGAVVWSQVDPYDEYFPEATDPQAIDLDADGVDELLYVETAGEGGGSSSALVVVGVAGGRPVSGRADLGYQSIDEDGCMAEWRVADGAIEITADGACASFAGSYRWNGTALVTQ